jgi:FtsH-binding integral membrane protein
MDYQKFNAAAENFSASVSNELALQSAFINRVFLWMTTGLAITAFAAYFTAKNFSDYIATAPGIFWGLIVAEFLLVLGLTAAIRTISPAVAVIGFILFAALNGVTLSWIFLVYNLNSITATFLSTSLTFGIMGLYGWVTKRDLTAIGSLGTMFLLGLIISSVINIFLRNSTFDLIISAVGVLVFVGLTAYDTQKIKQLAVGISDGEYDGETAKKAAVIGALQLYLDFVNLFLYLLRLFGRRR